MVKNRLHHARGGTSDELQNTPKRSIRLPVLPLWRSQQQARRYLLCMRTPVWFGVLDGLIDTSTAVGKSQGTA
jgi:hypothetical protein